MGCACEQDSIGGNSKTFIVATISPVEDCLGETLSALQFAQRAKMVKTNAVSVGEWASGSV